MSGFVASALPRQDGPGPSEHRIDALAAERNAAPAGNGAAAALSPRNPQTQSMLQLREALDNGPGVQSHLALQRAINRRSVDVETAQAHVSPGLRGKEIGPVRSKLNATGLPGGLKAGVEHLSGFAMDDVRVHYNSPRPETMQAHAFAQGTDIHVAPGQERHLPHEAWHVVQQKQGRVKPTLQLKGLAINDDAGLEREADVMGSAALRHQDAGSASPHRSRPQAATNAATRTLHQRKIKTSKKVYDSKDGTAATSKALGDILASGATYVTHDDAHLNMALTYGAATVPLLSPHHHLIGERHDESSAAEIKEAWGGLVPIALERALPDLKDQRGVKAPTAADTKKTKQEEGFAPLEELNARTIYTIAHLLDLMEGAKAALASKKIVPAEDRLKMAQCIGIIAGVAGEQYAKATPDTFWGWGWGARKENAARLEQIQNLLDGKMIALLYEFAKRLAPKDMAKSAAAGSGGASASSSAVDAKLDTKSDVAASEIETFVTSAGLLKRLQTLKDVLLGMMKNQERPPTAAVGGGSKASDWSEARSAAAIIPVPKDFHKYNALREEFMVRTVLSQGKPSIAIMGEAHVGQIRKEWHDASLVYYTNVAAFEAGITQVFSGAAAVAAVQAQGVQPVANTDASAASKPVQPVVTRD